MYIYINGVEIQQELFDQDLVDYGIVEKEDEIDGILEYYSQYNDGDKYVMKQDLKYLIKLNDSYIIKTTGNKYCEYIANSDQPERFAEKCEELLSKNAEFKNL